MTRLLIAALAVAACGTPPPVAPTGAAGGAGTPCDAARTRVEQLYRAGAPAQDRVRIDELVADNTAMVMNDCATSPEPTAACIAAAATVAELEAQCLIPLDDEGTEGDHRSR